jgi:hypothetical protein
MPKDFLDPHIEQQDRTAPQDLHESGVVLEVDARRRQRQNRF